MSANSIRQVADRRHWCLPIQPLPMTKGNVLTKKVVSTATKVNFLAGNFRASQLNGKLPMTIKVIFQQHR